MEYNVLFRNARYCSRFNCFDNQSLLRQLGISQTKKRQTIKKKKIIFLNIKKKRYNQKNINIKKKYIQLIVTNFPNLELFQLFLPIVSFDINLCLSSNHFILIDAIRSYLDYVFRPNIITFIFYRYYQYLSNTYSILDTYPHLLRSILSHLQNLKQTNKENLIQFLR